MGVSTSNGRAPLRLPETGSVSIIEGNASPVRSCHRTRGRAKANETRYCRTLRNVQKLILDEAGGKEGDQNAARRNRKGRCEFYECEMGCPARARVLSSSPQGRLSAEWAPSRTKAGHLQRSTQ